MVVSVKFRVQNPGWTAAEIVFGNDVDAVYIYAFWLVHWYYLCLCVTAAC